MSRRFVRAALPIIAIGAMVGGAQAKPADHRAVTGTIALHDATDRKAADELFGTAPKPSEQGDIFALVQGFGNPPVDGVSAAVRDLNTVFGNKPRPSSETRARPVVRQLRTAVARLPEPATWTMLILGFGAIGGIVRHRLRRSEERFNERIRRIAAGDDLG